MRHKKSGAIFATPLALASQISAKYTPVDMVKVVTPLEKIPEAKVFSRFGKKAADQMVRIGFAVVSGEHYQERTRKIARRVLSNERLAASINSGNGKDIASSSMVLSLNSVSPRNPLSRFLLFRNGISPYLLNEIDEVNQTLTSIGLNTAKSTRILSQVNRYSSAEGEFAFHQDHTKGDFAIANFILAIDHKGKGKATIRGIGEYAGRSNVYILEPGDRMYLRGCLAGEIDNPGPDAVHPWHTVTSLSRVRISQAIALISKL